MSAIYLLIPLSLLVALVFLAGFIWAVRSGQYDDTDTPAMRLLTEDPPEADTDLHPAFPEEEPVPEERGKETVDSRPGSRSQRYPELSLKHQPNNPS